MLLEIGMKALGIKPLSRGKKNEQSVRTEPRGEAHR
jgi:hypothetical protein